MPVVTTNGLADKLGPKIQAAFASREKELVSAGDSWFVRQAIHLAYPTFLDQIPTLTCMAIDFVATEFGNMNINDLLAFLDAHAQQGRASGQRFRVERNSASGSDGSQFRMDERITADSGPSS